MHGSAFFPGDHRGGLIKVLLVIFGPTLLGVMSDTSDTYILMNALGDAPFYFLPVIVAFTASRKLNCNLSVRRDTGDARKLFFFHYSGNALYDPAEICGASGGQVYAGLVEELPETFDHCSDHGTHHALSSGAAGTYGRKRAAAYHQQRVRIRSMAGNAYIRRIDAIYHYDGNALGICACMPDCPCGSGI